MTWRTSSSALRVRRPITISATSSKTAAPAHAHQSPPSCMNQCGAHQPCESAKYPSAAAATRKTPASRPPRTAVSRPESASRIGPSTLPPNDGLLNQGSASTASHRQLYRWTTNSLGSNRRGAWTTSRSPGSGCSRADSAGRTGGRRDLFSTGSCSGVPYRCWQMSRMMVDLPDPSRPPTPMQPLDMWTISARRLSRAVVRMGTVTSATELSRCRPAPGASISVPNLFGGTSGLIAS